MTIITNTTTKQLLPPPLLLSSSPLLTLLLLLVIPLRQQLLLQPQILSPPKRLLLLLLIPLPQQQLLLLWLILTNTTTLIFLRFTGRIQLYISFHCSHMYRTELSLLGNILVSRFNILFKDALNTFCLQLDDVGHSVMNHSDSERNSRATLYD